MTQRQSQEKNKFIFTLDFFQFMCIIVFTIYRGVEQLVARRAHNPEVGGSNPPSATKEIL